MYFSQKPKICRKDFEITCSTTFVFRCGVVNLQIVSIIIDSLWSEDHQAAIDRTAITHTHTHTHDTRFFAYFLMRSDLPYGFLCNTYREKQMKPRALGGRNLSVNCNVDSLTRNTYVHVMKNTLTRSTLILPGVSLLIKCLTGRGQAVLFVIVGRNVKRQYFGSRNTIIYLMRIKITFQSSILRLSSLFFPFLSSFLFSCASRG